MAAKVMTRELEMVSEGLARIKEAAKFLGFSLSYIYLLLDCGELPSVGRGKTRRVPWRAVKEYAARRLNTAGAAAPEDLA